MRNEDCTNEPEPHNHGEEAIILHVVLLLLVLACHGQNIVHDGAEQTEGKKRRIKLPIAIIYSEGGENVQTVAKQAEHDRHHDDEGVDVVEDLA